MPSPATPPVVGVGASAGGVEALCAFFSALPGDAAAAFLVVLHMPPYSRSHLPDILAAVSPFPVSFARDGEAVRAGHVYVGTPDRHLLVEGGHIRLSRGPKECRVRPSIDVLFRSLALGPGSRAAGVVLSGMLDDGTAGLWAIKEHGGRTYVQDPAEALHGSMPASAAEHVEVDVIAGVAALGADVAAWSRKVVDRASGEAADKERLVLESSIALGENALRHGVMALGEPSTYACPDCHGVLVEIREGSVVRFRCHTGHAFSMKTLLAEVDNAIDKSLWETIRAMEERILLLRQMAQQTGHLGDALQARLYEGHANELEKPIDELRAMVLHPTHSGHEAVG